MTTFNIEKAPTKYKEILDGIIEQGRALKSLHNPQTWRLSALAYALQLHDCTVLFSDVKDRWKNQLPFSEAWDTDFAFWKNEVWSAVIDTNSFTSIDKYGNWKYLCESDINVFLKKASDCLKGIVPITEVLDFLNDKETGLSEVILKMGEELTIILAEIDEIPITASNEQYEIFYESLMNIYMTENKNNPFPIIVGDDIISFDKWIATKTEKQRRKSINSKLSTINSRMLDDNCWRDIWEENVYFEQRYIEKEGIGREIFANRKVIIESEKNPGECFNAFFSSLALCSHLWEYEVLQNADAFDKLTESRREIINRVEALIEKGDWVEPATDDIMKEYMRQVLGVGRQKLFGDQLKMSNTLWSLFELGTIDRIRITFQNFIGYFLSHFLLPEKKGADLLNKDFFGREATTYQNIYKGGDLNKMPSKFKEILPLLDYYLPKKNANRKILE